MSSPASPRGHDTITAQRRPGGFNVIRVELARPYPPAADALVLSSSQLTQTKSSLSGGVCALKMMYGGARRVCIKIVRRRNRSIGCRGNRPRPFEGLASRCSEKAIQRITVIDVIRLTCLLKRQVYESPWYWYKNTQIHNIFTNFTCICHVYNSVAFSNRTAVARWSFYRYRQLGQFWKYGASQLNRNWLQSFNA